jgi:hypothetical protein
MCVQVLKPKAQAVYKFLIMKPSDIHPFPWDFVHFNLTFGPDFVVFQSLLASIRPIPANTWYSLIDYIIIISQQTITYPN